VSIKAFKLYNALIESIESYEIRLYEKYRDQIKCCRGCSRCCIIESVFPIEAWNIYLKIKNEPSLMDEVDKKPEQCIFLKDDACLIYDVRPLICRSHGYPIFIENKTDFCPLNFADVQTIDSGYILNLEALNRGIATANLFFIQENSVEFFNQERVRFNDLLEYIEKEINRGRG
jgi:Fe-S-cluster containining protein